MAQLLKAFSTGLSVLFLYVLTVFIAPIVMLLLGYSNIVSKPTLLGSSLYIIEIEDTTFSTEATGFGCILAFLLGLLIHYLMKLLIGFRRGQEAR